MFNNIQQHIIQISGFITIFKGFKWLKIVIQDNKLSIREDSMHYNCAWVNQQYQFQIYV